MERSNLLMYVCLLFLVAKAGATQFKVGGSSGWTVLATNTASYNQWAEANRFQIGDSLVFVYPQDNDSVLVVDQEAYNTCNTSSYIKKFDDGNTVFTFDRSGSFFFISGIHDNCLKKESLIVVVLANRTRQSDNQPSSSPPTMSPSGSPVVSSPPLSPPAIASAPAPVEFATPPPNGESGSAVPPSGAENNPSIAHPPNVDNNTPSSGENPSSPPPPSPSDASIKIATLIGSTGSLLGMIMLTI